MTDEEFAVYAAGEWFPVVKAYTVPAAREIGRQLKKGEIAKALLIQVPVTLLSGLTGIAFDLAKLATEGPPKKR